MPLINSDENQLVKILWTVSTQSIAPTSTFSSEELCEEVNDEECIVDPSMQDYNDGKHYWLKCMFKNPTFCLVCGKIVSVLGDVPLDEENNVPLSVKGWNLMHSENELWSNEVFGSGALINTYIHYSMILTLGGNKTRTPGRQNRLQMQEVYDEYSYRVCKRSRKIKNFNGLSWNTRSPINSQAFPRTWGKSRSQRFSATLFGLQTIVAAGI